MIEHLDLIDRLELPDPGDRHVLAAACHAGATVIVTYNLQDFPTAALERFAIEAQHPDAFVTDLLDLDEDGVLATVRQHRSQLKSPRRTATEYLTTLDHLGLVRTVARLRVFEHAI